MPWTMLPANPVSDAICGAENSSPSIVAIAAITVCMCTLLNSALEASASVIDDPVTSQSFPHMPLVNVTFMTSDSRFTTSGTIPKRNVGLAGGSRAVTTEEVLVRVDVDKVVRIPACEVSRDKVAMGLPFRAAMSRRGQRHFPGWYWAATMSGLVWYESRLELSRLQLADFDPQVIWMGSQPFQLVRADAARTRRHVPDFLFGLEDGRMRVVDVKPRDRLTRPKVRMQFDWTREVVEGWGWEYRVESEPDPVLARNVRFLAGYRRVSQFLPDEVDAAIAAVTAPTSVGAAIRQVTGWRPLGWCSSRCWVSRR